MSLQIFEKHPETDAYRVGGFYSPYCLVSTDKRFSDAELAAEYWAMTYFCAGAQFNESSSGQAYSDEFWDRNYGRVNTLHRFATSPHHDA